MVILREADLYICLFVFFSGIWPSTQYMSHTFTCDLLACVCLNAHLCVCTDVDRKLVREVLFMTVEWE